MKSLLIAAAVAASVAFAGAAQASEALAKDKGCLGCHATDAKKWARASRTSRPSTRARRMAKPPSSAC